MNSLIAVSKPYNMARSNFKHDNLPYYDNGGIPAEHSVKIMKYFAVIRPLIKQVWMFRAV